MGSKKEKGRVFLGPFVLGANMRLLFYMADEEYCEYLMGADRRVPSIKGAKSGRPFVGIVFEVKGIPYFAPLTSPKEKHKTMREMPDFMK